MAYTLNDVPVAGFLVVLPLDFAGGQFALMAENAFALVHLALSPSAKAAFPTYTRDLLAGGEVDWEFKNKHGHAALTLNDFTVRRAISSQAIGVGETFVLLGGNKSVATKILFPGLPPEPFPNFMVHVGERFTWGGELILGNVMERHSRLLTVAEAVVDINVPDRSVASFAVSGPVKATDPHARNDQSCFKWLVDNGHWYQTVVVGKAEEAKPHAAQALSMISLVDLRRNLELPFFGEGPLGLAQSVTAKGGAFFVSGSFATRLSAHDLERFCIAAHSGIDEVRSRAGARLAVPPLMAAQEDRSDFAQEAPDTLNEGLAVWGLQARRGGGQEEAAGPIFL